MVPPIMSPRGGRSGGVEVEEGGEWASLADAGGNDKAGDLVIAAPHSTGVGGVEERNEREEIGGKAPGFEGKNGL